MIYFSLKCVSYSRAEGPAFKYNHKPSTVHTLSDTVSGDQWHVGASKEGGGYIKSSRSHGPNL